jgi:metallo-beta-lactamase superfamily protein
VRTIADDILTWSWFSEPHSYDFNGFLITDRSGIDPVEPSEQVLHELAQRGVSRILLTNRNHVRAANRVRSSTGAPNGNPSRRCCHARGQGAELDDELQGGREDRRAGHGTCPEEVMDDPARLRETAAGMTVPRPTSHPRLDRLLSFSACHNNIDGTSDANTHRVEDPPVCFNRSLEERDALADLLDRRKLVEQ